MLNRGTLHHPARLKIYLAMRRQQSGETATPISVRELQRLLGLESTSSVIWHLDKMIDAGYVKKGKDNRHILTKEALNDKYLSVPIDIPIMMIRGRLLPKRLLLLSFLLSSVVIALLFTFIDFRLATIFLFFSLLVTAAIVIWEYLSISQDLEDYLGK